jgi:hypothetical protein
LGVETIDETALERLWGAELNQIKPEVKAIILSALKKVRERRERNQTLVARDSLVQPGVFVADSSKPQHESAQV